MPIHFPHYVQIKDKYCCYYLGNSPEYVVALRLLKPQIEEQLPGLKLCIGCLECFKYLLEDEKDVTFNVNKKEFAYVREIRNNSLKHSILSLMEESNLKINPVSKINSKKGGLCLICPEGIEPTKPMTQSDIATWKEKAIQLGYAPIVVGSDVHHSLSISIRPNGNEKFKYLEEANWLIGVENEYILLGATKGIKTTLIKTGIGHTLFKQLAPGIEVVS